MIELFESRIRLGPIDLKKTVLSVIRDWKSLEENMMKKVIKQQAQ
jgi:hypothetical protein